MVRVLFDEHFQNKISKIKDNEFRKQVERLIEKIINNPEIGKPMRYDRKGTREVYASSYRLAYAYLQ